MNIDVLCINCQEMINCDDIGNFFFCDVKFKL